MPQNMVFQIPAQKRISIQNNINNIAEIVMDYIGCSIRDWLGYYGALVGLFSDPRIADFVITPQAQKSVEKVLSSPHVKCDAELLIAVMKMQNRLGFDPLDHPACRPIAVFWDTYLPMRRAVGIAALAWLDSLE